MTTVLITAFETYDRWQSNASWLALVELTQGLPAGPQVTTRLYPVDFTEVRERLIDDLSHNYDIALHMGQAPGSRDVQLEAIGINIGGHSSQAPDDYQPLVEDGPAAYRSQLPLAHCSKILRRQGVPVRVSYHAGTYLCNATMYLAHHIIATKGLKTKVAFIHLPLEPSQINDTQQDLPSLPAATSAKALRMLIEELANETV